MSLAGEGVVAIWNDITPEMRAQFYEWHNREHMPERVGIPGFRRGRRYIALSGAPEYFTLYETDTPQTLAGTDYLSRLNSPTAWTKSTVTGFRNVSRSLCRVVLSLGTGQGGHLVTWRYDVAPGRDDEHRRHLAHSVLPALADRPGIVGVHLCIADQAASGIETAEKKARADKTLIPDWVLMVEGGAEARELDAICTEVLPETQFRATGAIAPIERGLYALQYTRSRTAGT